MTEDTSIAVKVTAKGYYGSKVRVPGESLVIASPSDFSASWMERADGKPHVADHASGSGLRANDDYREDLKKQAKELGIEHPRNVTNEKLKELIDAALSS